MVILSIALTTAACDEDSGDPGCPDATTGKRVPLVMTGGAPRDISGLAMCTDETGTSVFIGNDTKDVWLVQPARPAAVLQHGGVPAMVQIFRASRSPGPLGGTTLEPGTAVTVALRPAEIGLAIDSVLQSQWSTMTVIDQTATAAREQLPELIRNEKYKSAVTSCLEASTRIVDYGAAARYDTQTLIQSLGLTTGTTRCAADLTVAENERQTLARQQKRLPPPELKISTFAQKAGSLSSELDDLLKAAGRLFSR